MLAGDVRQRIVRALCYWAGATLAYFFGAWKFNLAVRSYPLRIGGMLVVTGAYATLAIMLARNVLAQVDAAHNQLRSSEKRAAKIEAEGQREQARLEGVLLAARTVAHEINNDLAITIGLAEITQSGAKNGESPSLQSIEGIVAGARRIAHHIDQLQNVVRLEERRYDNGRVSLLDLTRSSGDK